MSTASMDGRTRRGFLRVAMGALVAPVACGGEPAPATPARAKTPSVPPAKAPVAAPAPEPPPVAAVDPTLKGVMIGPGKMVDTDTGREIFLLGLVDLDAEKLEGLRIPMTFFGHGVSPDPTAPHMAVVFEKIGKGCCQVDLRNRTVTRPIETLESRQFYGHGAFSADGSLLYATEVKMDDGNSGVIAVRDGRDFKLLGTFPTHGVGPHDCHLIDDGKTMVITNGGDPVGGPVRGSVTYVDVQSQKLLEKLEFDSPNINAGHAALTADGGLAVVSAPRDGLENREKLQGALTLRPAGGKFETMTKPGDVTAGMLGETLSVAIHEPTSTVAATNPEGDVITFWNLKTRKLIKALDMPAARGVALTLNGEEFVISYGMPPSLQRMNPKTLELIGKPFNRAQASGSHIILHTWS